MTSLVAQVLIDKINEYTNVFVQQLSLASITRVIGKSGPENKARATAAAVEAMGKISGLTAEINGVLSNNPTGQQAWSRLLKIIGVGKLNLEESQKFKKQIPGWIAKYLKPL